MGKAFKLPLPGDKHTRVFNYSHPLSEENLHGVLADNFPPKLFDVHKDGKNYYVVMQIRELEDRLEVELVNVNRKRTILYTIVTGGGHTVTYD